MKISPVDSISEILPKEIQPVEKTADNSFEDILNKKIEDLNISKPGLEPSLSMQKTSDILLIPPVEETEVISKLEKFLDTLEEYSEKLNNTDFTPQNISGVISKMELEKEELGIMSEALSGNNELKGILNDALIKSTAEVIKFNRGDYL